MFRSLSRIALATVVSTLVLICGAAAEEWHISRSSGPVFIGSDTAQLVSLGSTTDVPGGSTVMTGDSGRLFLVRGIQTMLIGPNTVVTLPDSDSHGITTVLERAGEITFDVDRQKVKHFAVETPYLAAVVKGTNFTVRVDGAGGMVAVNRGLVEVQDLATGELVDTPVGQTARVNGQSGELTVSGSGPSPAIRPGSPRAPMMKGLTGEQMKALQVAALKNSDGATPGLTPVLPAEPRKDDAAVAVAAAGQGGPGGGDTGGSATGGGGAGGSKLAMPQAQSPQPAKRSFFDALFRNEDGDGLSTTALASIFGLSVALAFGLAFFRGKFS